MTESNYWMRAGAGRVSRRRLLHAAGVGGLGLAGAALIGCGSDDEEPGTPGGNGDGGATSTPAGEQTAAPVTGEPVDGGSLTFHDTEPPNWDPHLQAPAGASGRALSYIYPSLVRYDHDHPDYRFGSTIVAPYLAESWEIPDNLTYVFKLRQGATWDDREPTSGREIVAEDVAYTFERFYTSEFLTGVTPQPAPEIEVQDDYTLTFRLETPNSQLLTFYANQNFVIVPHEVEDAFGDFKLADNARGAGPWIIEQNVPGSRVVFRKNPKYMLEGRPHMDQITVLYDLGTEAQLASFRSGELDIVNTIQPAQIESVRQSVPDATYYQRAGCCGRSIGARLDVAPTSDLRVRQAISKSLDRQTWLDRIHHGTGYLPYSVYTDLWQEFTLPEEKVSEEARYNHTYDPEEARALLEAAGGFGGEVGVHVYPSSDPTYEQEATLAMDFMSQIGIETRLVTADYGAYIATTYRGDYDGLAFFPVGEFSPAGLLNRYTPGGGGRNVNHVDDPELNDIMDRFYATTDQEEAIELCHQLQLISAEQLYFIMAPHAHTYHASQARVKGYEGRIDTAYGTGVAFDRIWLEDA